MSSPPPPVAPVAPASNGSTPQASVIIPTRNRKDLLRQVIQSALAQTVPVEIIVLDDGSTDGTSDAIRAEFPTVRVHRQDRSQGPTAERNRGAGMTAAPFLFMVDDDCVLQSPRTVEQTLAAFEHPRIGAVTIPFIDVLKAQTLRCAAPSAGDIYVSGGFFGGMVAFRRDAFMAAGGYREFLFMHVEEPDLAIRLLNAGYVIRLGSADPIHHYESPIRNQTGLYAYGPRNHVLYAWYNVPMPYFPVHMAVTSARTFGYCCRVRQPRLGLVGLARGYAGCVHEWGQRRPVRPGIYRLIRRLNKSGPFRLAEIEGDLHTQTSSHEPRSLRQGPPGK